MRVFVLGAGASKAAFDAAPLNNELLPGIFQLYRSHIGVRWSNDYASERVRVFLKFVCDFYLGGIDPLDANEPLPPLEDVLTQLDYGIAEQRPLSKEYSVEVLSKIREHLIYALYKLLKERLGPHSPGLMEEFIQKLDPEDVIVSLNYDLIVDNAQKRVWARQYGYDSEPTLDYGIPVRTVYHLDGFTQREHSAVGQKLLKPHGSLNWLYCPLCQQIDVFEGEKAVGRIFRETDETECGQCRVRYDPIIITPTFLKSYGNSFVAQIWRATEAALRDAQEIIFLGYSLPDADMMLRTMFSRAWYMNQAQHRPRCRILVVDKPSRKAQEDATLERFTRLFGTVDYSKDGFKHYVDHSL